MENFEVNSQHYFWMAIPLIAAIAFALLAPSFVRLYSQQVWIVAGSMIVFVVMIGIGLLWRRCNEVQQAHHEDQQLQQNYQDAAQLEATARQPLPDILG